MPFVSVGYTYMNLLLNTFVTEADRPLTGHLFQSSGNDVYNNACRGGRLPYLVTVSHITFY